MSPLQELLINSMNADQLRIGVFELLCTLNQSRDEVRRLRSALQRIERGDIPGAADAALKGELAFALQAFARAVIDGKEQEGGT